MDSILCFISSELDKRAWSQVQLGQTIHRRIAHSATQVGSYLFVIGGHNSTDYCSEVLLFNLGSFIVRFLYYS